MNAPDTSHSAQLTGLTELLKGSGGVVECLVVGASMGEIVPDGSMARIRCDGAVNAAARPRTGDVVALLLGGELALHRLVHRGRSARAKGWVVTEGDANLTCDAPVQEHELLGVVEASRTAEGAWRAPAPSTLRAILPRTVASVVRGLVCVGLEVHPRVARAIKGVVVAVMTPLVWLRPYPAGTTRRASIAHRDR